MMKRGGFCRPLHRLIRRAHRHHTSDLTGCQWSLNGRHPVASEGMDKRLDIARRWKCVARLAVNG